MRIKWTIGMGLLPYLSGTFGFLDFLWFVDIEPNDRIVLFSATVLFALFTWTCPFLKDDK